MKFAKIFPYENFLLYGKLSLTDVRIARAIDNVKPNAAHTNTR